MKLTPFFEIHTALNAKMALFGGYQMPIQYPGGVKNEHLTVRENLGVFDISHMGEFIIEGPQALDLLQYICSNDIAKLNPGKAQYNYLPNKTGGIVDDLIVYQLEKEKYLMVVNASNIDKDWKWINSFNQFFKVDISNVSDKTSLLAIQGPKAIEAMQPLCDTDLKNLENYCHTTTSFAGFKNILVATTGYTGSGGIEIYFNPEYAKTIWESIMSAGSDYGISPIGLAARDTLRIEMGYCLYGNEINDTTPPISAGLNWITKPNTNFINNKNYEVSIKNESDKKLIGFEMDTRGIPRSDYLIYDKKENPIGKVTSGTQSPSLNKGIGLGYVNSDFSEIGENLFIRIRDKFVPCTIVRVPFYRY
jgi:aminomethyltransferase